MFDMKQTPMTIIHVDITDQIIRQLGSVPGYCQPGLLVPAMIDKCAWFGRQILTVQLDLGPPTGKEES